MTTDTTESQERLTPRFLVKAILAAAGIIALWVLTVTVTRPWVVEVARGGMNPDDPLALGRGEGFGRFLNAATLVPGITVIVAMAITLAVLLVIMENSGKRALVLLLLLFLSVGFLGFSIIAATDGPLNRTNDPVVMEWAQERYGVELVGDAWLEGSPTLILDDGTTVVATVIETSAGSSLILTEEELGELPVITP